MAARQSFCRCCCSCCHRRRRARNESLLVMSLIQGLCSLCTLILAAVSLASARTRNTAQLDKAACIVSGLVMLVTSAHGIATSRRKVYCTVMALMVLCILSCISNISLLLSCACGLYQFATGGGQQLQQSSLAVPDLVTSLLLLLIGLLDLSVATACAVVCGRQVCRHDRRIALHPDGRGLIVLDSPPVPPSPPPYTAQRSPPPPPPPPPPPFLLTPLLPPSYNESQEAV